MTLNDNNKNEEYDIGYRDGYDDGFREFYEKINNYLDTHSTNETLIRQQLKTILNELDH